MACGKAGLLTPEAASKFCGPGLAEVCETTGMPPVLHMGSCVDNTRILTILADIVETGGLGDDIDQVPAVGISPEYYCEKALEIATYCVGSGAYVIFGGVDSRYRASDVVTSIHGEKWEEIYGGKLHFIPKWEDIFQASMDHIQKKREALGINVAKERVLFDMADRRA